jgi:hypothetical protein
MKVIIFITNWVCAVAVLEAANVSVNTWRFWAIFLALVLIAISNFNEGLQAGIKKST